MNLITSVLIVAPHEVQAIAAPLLQRYSLDDLIRGPAHLTVMYPFVAYDRLREACATLRVLCAEVQPFEVTMQGYGHFPLAVFMAPANPEPVRTLFRKIYAAFPECPPYRGLYGDDLQPHMTIAEFATEADRMITLPDFSALPPYEPVTFKVERLHIAYGIEKAPLPWITHDIVPLGG